MTTRRGFLKGLSATIGATVLSPHLRAQFVPTPRRYPYVQNLNHNRATILWTTLESGPSVVQYSDRIFANTVIARTQVFSPRETGLGFTYYQQQAELTGLNGGVEYLYRVMLDGQNLTPGDELLFRTAGTGPFNFLVFGDSGQGTEAQLQVARLMQQQQAALVLHTGDVVYPSGTFEQYQRNYFDYYWNLMKRVPFFPCPGNHDYLGGTGAAYLSVHSVPADDVPPDELGRYYSFDWGNVHFVSLDTQVSLSRAIAGRGQMLEWLENDLRKTRQFWRIVYFHHTPYGSGLNQNDLLGHLAREHIVPILERHGVQLVFSGHEHSYQRSVPLWNGMPARDAVGIVYITTGGGGADLYPIYASSLIATGKSTHHYVRAGVEGTRITVRAIQVDGQEIDRITLRPPPLISDFAVLRPAASTLWRVPGGVVTILGRNLAAQESRALTRPLPTELADTSVTLGGERLPLISVSTNQITAQLPFDVEGRPTVRVFTANGSAETSLVVSPGLFSRESLPSRRLDYVERKLRIPEGSNRD